MSTTDVTGQCDIIIVGFGVAGATAAIEVVDRPAISGAIAK